MPSWSIEDIPRHSDLAGVEQHPIERSSELDCVVVERRYPLDVGDGGSQRSESFLKLVVVATRHDDLIFGEARCIGELPGDVGLLATAWLTPATRAPGTGGLQQRGAAPTAPRSASSRGLAIVGSSVVGGVIGGMVAGFPHTRTLVPSASPSAVATTATPNAS